MFSLWDMKNQNKGTKLMKASSEDLNLAELKVLEEVGEADGCVEMIEDSGGHLRLPPGWHSSGRYSMEMYI